MYTAIMSARDKRRAQADDDDDEDGRQHKQQQHNDKPKGKAAAKRARFDDRVQTKEFHKGLSQNCWYFQECVIGISALM